MRVELEWGAQGARRLAETADALVVVDVLSFSTAVGVAVERGARVWPHPGGESAHQLARSIEAVLAGRRGTQDGPSLSPSSLVDLPEGTRLVLPSPNGSAITHALGQARCTVLAGSLRNADAVARHVAGAAVVGLVPAGERWGDESLRVAYEDLVGAGAIATRLLGLDPSTDLSPEAEAAAAAFARLRPLVGTPSGQELADRGYTADIEIAEQVDASGVVPVLRDGCFTAA